MDTVKTKVELPK